jgi:hypothetical protein
MSPQAVAQPVVSWRLGARIHKSVLLVPPTALLVAMALAVFKPWGRIRSKQPTARRNGSDRRRHGHAAATHAKS